jgi:glycine/D-amino acid oxidase-like deaminating enzyme
MLRTELEDAMWGEPGESRNLQHTPDRQVGRSSSIASAAPHANLFHVRHLKFWASMAMYRPGHLGIERAVPLRTAFAPTQSSTRKFRLRATPTTISTDVVVVGSGIIGLSIASALLRADDNLQVLVLDKAGLCAGATGAGQGYLWLAHRDPAANLATWQLATRSVKLWGEMMASSPEVRERTEYQRLGSMLLATSAEEAVALKDHAERLRDAGVLNVDYYSASAAQEVERQLTLPSDGAAMIVPADTQIDGRATASIFLEVMERLNKESVRFKTIYHEACRSLITDASTGRVNGVETVSGIRITANHGVVMATGAWSGDFLSRELGNPRWKSVFRARKGHLVEIPRSDFLNRSPYDASNGPLLRHGLMEFGYSRHYCRPLTDAFANKGDENMDMETDVTFTATTSASGSLLLGSSRQFIEHFPSADAFASDVNVVTAIIEEARRFIPSLIPPLRECLKTAKVRVGPRPYSSTGMPLIGPVPGVSGLYLAAGHEGSGLTLCLATAEIIVEDVLRVRNQDLNEEQRDSFKALRPQLL